MPAAKRGLMLSLFWRLHKWVLQLSGGRSFDRLGKLNVLLLHTVGRKSGKPRLTALNYVVHGSAYVVVASNAGADFDPAWWLNLQGRPKAEIETRGVKRKVIWRVAQAAEAETLYAKFVEAEDGYAEYKRRTARPIPVVILEPLAGG